MPDAPSIGHNIAAVRERILRACERCGRAPDNIQLVAVSKFHPVSAIEEAMREGLTHFGESRPQELHRKWLELRDSAGSATPHWHMIGSVQRNKAKLVAEAADVVHSVDSLRLAKALSVRLDGRTLECLIQVNISSEESKSGVEPEMADDLVSSVATLPGLNVVGLMGMASISDDAEQVRPQFRLLRETANRISDLEVSGVSMRHLSMGMSHDLEVAVEEGATIVRIGTAIFGHRPA